MEQCAKAGYTVLDVNLCEAMNPASELRTDRWEAYVGHIARAASAMGIALTQSHLPYYSVYGAGAGGKRELMEELIRRSILASGMLGVRWAVTHPATVYAAGNDLSVSLEANLGYYGPHVALAGSAGVGIALENDFEYRSEPYQRVFGASVHELNALADAFGDPVRVGVCYDFGHANLTGGFHRKDLNAIGKRLKATHVQDNHGAADEHLMPLYGTTDWEDAMAGLADIGYEGDLTFEIQEFGRFFPNEHKHLVIEQSLRVGQILTDYFEQAKRRKTAGGTDAGAEAALRRRRGP